jgi:hypothetical protein
MRAIACIASLDEVIAVAQSDPAVRKSRRCNFSTRIVHLPIRAVSLRFGNDGSIVGQAFSSPVGDAGDD